MILFYAGLSMICFLCAYLYKSRGSRLVCVTSGFFFILSVIYGLNPEFRAGSNEIPVYWAVNFGLFLFLISLKANKTLCSICFVGLIAHSIGHLSYLFDNYQLLMMYNQSILFINVLYTLVLLGFTDDGMAMVDRSGNFLRNLYGDRDSI